MEYDKDGVVEQTWLTLTLLNCFFASQLMAGAKRLKSLLENLLNLQQPDFESAFLLTSGSPSSTPIPRTGTVFWVSSKGDLMFWCCNVGNNPDRDHNRRTKARTPRLSSVIPSTPFSSGSTSQKHDLRCNKQSFSPTIHHLLLLRYFPKENHLLSLSKFLSDFCLIHRPFFP